MYILGFHRHRSAIVVRQVSRGRDAFGNANPDKNPKWWPVLWSPRARAGFFDLGSSPFGRSPLPFDTQDEFDELFWDTDVKDVMFPDVCSINPAFECPQYNVNSIGYPPDVVDNQLCPMYKYLNFSPDRRRDIAEAQIHQLRLSQMQGAGIAADGSQLDMTMPAYTASSDVSVTCGIAIVKRCYTHHALLNGENQNRFPSIYPGGHLVQDKRNTGTTSSTRATRRSRYST